MATNLRRRLQKINEARPDQSQAKDDAQLHSKVIEPNDSAVKSWVRDPGTADIQGIDTPRKTKIQRSASKVAKRAKRTSSNSSPTMPRMRQTARGKAQDRVLTHSVIIKPSSPKVKKWLQDPGTADIKGIDTPRARISRRTPRISPRMGRLR